MLKKEQLNVLIQLASSDNQIEGKEIKLIQILAKANDIPLEEINKMIKNPTPIGDLTNLPEDQKFEYLYNVVQLMKIDGKVFKSEIVFCEEIANKLGYNKGVIKELSSKIFSTPSITSNREKLQAKTKKYLK